MNLTTLKFLRWMTPGVLFYLLTLPILPVLPDWLKFNVDLELPAFQLPIASLVFASIYDFAGFRLHSNEAFHQRVKSNIEDRLWQIARASLSRPPEWTHKKARDIFYQLIDNDNSLTTRAKTIYFNGFLWTTSADIRIVSLLILFLTFGMALADLSSTAVQAGLLVNSAFFGLSFFASEALTRRHIKLGNEQLDYIETHLKEALSSKIAALGL